MSDKEEIRHLIDGVLQKYTDIIDLKFKLVHSELVHIREQTTKTNSRTNKLEEEVKLVDKHINEHARVCPAMKEITMIEKKVEQIVSVRRFVLQSLAIMASAAVVVTAVFHIIQMM